MNLLSTPRGRRFLFACLYLSEGAPVGYVWWALPTKLRAAGMPVEEITRLTAMLVLPWAFKFLWAPLVDALRTARWDLRAWIISMQMLMGAALAPFCFLSIGGHLHLAAVLLLAHAILAATQDVAVDALCITHVPQAERGAINGWMQVGYLAGRAAFGGAALYAEQWLGERGVIIGLLACIWFSTLLVANVRESEAISPQDSRHATGRFSTFAQSLAGALRRRSTWLGLAFAVVGAAAFESVGGVSGPLFIEGGLKQEDVGLFYLFFALPGGLLGGKAADRLGRRGSVTLILTAIAVNVGLIAATTSLEGRSGRFVLVGLMGLLYVLIGAFTAASYALFMDLTDPRLGATQFSAFMGATNLCEAWSVGATGLLIGRFGYRPTFLIMAAVSLAALPILGVLRTETDVKRRFDRH